MTCEHFAGSNHGPWDGYTCRAPRFAVVVKWAESVMDGKFDIENDSGVDGTLALSDPNYPEDACPERKLSGVANTDPNEKTKPYGDYMFMFEWFNIYITANNQQVAADHLRTRLLDKREDCPNDDGVYTLEQWVRENREFNDGQHDNVGALQYMRLVPPEELVTLEFADALGHLKGTGGDRLMEVGWDAIPEILDHASVTIDMECREWVELLEENIVLLPPWM